MARDAQPGRHGLTFCQSGPTDPDVFALRPAGLGARRTYREFHLEAAEQIPTDQFRLNHRGSGSAQYPPTMLLALLIYSYATGRFGSRTIEAASYSDVAVRYLCANHHPDHDSIYTFRTANDAAFRATIAPDQGGRTISIDGTKTQANASKHAAVVVADLGVNWIFRPGAEFYPTLENLTDQRVETGLNADGIVNTGTPRFVTGGFRLSWSKSHN